MLETARPVVRTRPVAHVPNRFAGGSVDIVLGLLMLPFGVAMWLIESMARGISSLSSK